MSLLVVVLALPLALTGRVWGPDWTVHAWLTWAQGAAISGGGPSHFLHTQSLGPFYPQFEFYGGTLYAISGSLSALLGGKALVAHSTIWLSAFVTAYAGLLWLSLLAGLRGWRAHAAPIVLVTSQYWLTNAYARGAFPELVATSALPLLVAAALGLLRADRLRPAPVFGLLWATLMVTGAHNITLMWGTVWLAAIGLVVLVALPRRGRDFPARRVLVVAGLFGLGIALSAWFLLPDLVYSPRTAMATVNSGAPIYWPFSDIYVRPSLVFSPFHAHAKDSGTDGLYTNLPVLALAWVLASAVLVRRVATRAERRALIGFGVVLVLLLWLLMAHWPWQLLPTRLQYVQYTFRLEAYIVLTLALMVLVTLRALGRRPVAGRAPAVLTAVLAFAVVSGVWQTWATGNSWEYERQTTFAGGVHQTPATWNDDGSYRDLSDPRVIAVRDDRWLGINPLDVHGDRYDELIAPPAGPEPIGTNIRAGAYQLKITGDLEPMGRTYDGKLVLRRKAKAVQAGAVYLQIAPRQTWPVIVGRNLTFGALALTALLFLALGARELWTAAMRAVLGAGPAARAEARR